MRLKPQSPPSQSARISATRVHLNDVKHVIALLAAAGFDVTVSDNQYDYDDLDELIRERGIHPKELKLTGEKRAPSVDRITIAFTGDRIDVQDSTYGRSGDIAFRVREYLAHTHSRIVESLHVGPAVLTIGVGWFLVQSGWGFKRAGVDVSGELGLAAAAWLAIAVAVRLGYAGIWLRPKHEGTFFARNADKIGLGLVTAVLGALTKALIDRLTAK